MLAGALPPGVSSCCCAASAFAGVGLRKGLDRAAGGGAGLGSRAAGLARGGRRMLRSCAEGPMVLRFLRDPVPNADAFSVDARMQHRGRGLPRGVARFFLLVDRSTRRKNPSRRAPASGGSTTSYGLRRWRIHRPHASTQDLGPRTQKRRILRHPQAQASQTPRPEASPRPAAGRGPFGDHPQRGPRQRSSWTRPTAGSAPARPRRPGSAPATTRPPHAAHRESPRARARRTRTTSKPERRVGPRGLG